MGPAVSPIHLPEVALLRQGWWWAPVAVVLPEWDPLLEALEVEADSAPRSNQGALLRTKWEDPGAPLRHSKWVQGGLVLVGVRKWWEGDLREWEGVHRGEGEGDICEEDHVGLGVRRLASNNEWDKLNVM